MTEDGQAESGKGGSGRMDEMMDNKLEQFVDETMKKTPLKWSMVVLLILCWILPITLTAYAMLYVMTSKINDQIQKTIVSSADNAIKICEMRMNAAVTASRRASTIKEAFKKYKEDGNRSYFYGKVKKFMEEQYWFDENFRNTFIIFTDEPDEQPQYMPYYGNTNFYAYKTAVRFREKVQPLALDISAELNTDIQYINVDGNIYMIRNIMDSSFSPFAVIVMELNTDRIFGSLESTWGYAASDIYIDKELLYSSLDEGTGKGKGIFQEKQIPEALLTANNRMASLINTNGEFYTYAVRKPEKYTIGYVMALDSQAIIDETLTIKYVCALFVLFMIPLILIVFLFFRRKITNPVATLIQASHVIEEGQFGYQIEKVGNSREFAYLQEAFNSMSAKLKHQVDTIYSEELALKDARIMALQSQINPHFLNNTLEIINWEARINENYKVSQMIENLSIMLEATMDRRHRRFVTMAEEMSYVDAYLFIIAQRLGERMQVVKNVDESLFLVKVPRLIIQPIIENAVEHGINGQTHAVINLNVFEEEDKLVIEVRNSGAMTGENEEKIEMLLSDDYEPGELGSASLGIRNVSRRIKIIYGETCGLTVKNDLQGGTVSRIVVKLELDGGKKVLPRKAGENDQYDEKI